MQLIRTTLRLKRDLKKAAQKHAADKDVTLQEVFNIALEEYLRKGAEKRAKKIIFLSQNLGTKLDNLRREDYYGTPRF